MPGAGVTVVSIFVNPLQFGPNEDLARYPRPLEADLAACREEGVELVFTPGGRRTCTRRAPTPRVTPGVLGTELEGAVRPGHFAGVLTVVSKLFHIVGPDVAFFGEKDYQQLVLIKKMVRDLDFPLSIAGVPIVREADGLALSSRNVYLSPEERRRALVLRRALLAGAGAAAHGADAVLATARGVLAEEPEVAVDYLALRAPDLGPTPAAGPAAGGRPRRRHPADRQHRGASLCPASAGRCGDRRIRAGKALGPRTGRTRAGRQRSMRAAGRRVLAPAEAGH